jgi:hypothetical protein
LNATILLAACAQLIVQYYADALAQAAALHLLAYYMCTFISSWHVFQERIEPLQSLHEWRWNAAKKEPGAHQKSLFFEQKGKMRAHKQSA